MDPMLSAPHARCNCRQPGYAFVKCPALYYGSYYPGTDILTQDKKFCPSCFCFVCDVEASKCEVWEKHCIADDTSQYWADMRTKERNTQAMEKLMNAEGLPRFMRGLPKEMEAHVLTQAQSDYRPEIRVTKPAPVASWPRLAGHLEFLLPRCVLHTHTDLPVNAALTSYFDINEGARPLLMDRAGKMKTSCEEVIRSLTSLQQAGCLQITWTVNHVEKPGFTAAVTEKLAQLAEHRPVTFDLKRKYVPPPQYREQRKVYEDRPAQAEGNSEWWKNVKCMACKPGPTAGHAAVSGHARPDSALTAAMSNNDYRTHSKENCCWMRAEIHFEKKLLDSTWHRKQLKDLMQGMVKNDFRADELIHSAELAAASPFPGLKAAADALLAAKKHKEAIVAYTKALAVPVRHRSASEAERKLCLTHRAQARLETGDMERAEDDCTLVLTKDRHCAQALHMYGKVLGQRSQQTASRLSVAERGLEMAAARAAVRCALVEDPENAEFLASLDSLNSGGASAPSGRAATTAAELQGLAFDELMDKAELLGVDDYELDRCIISESNADVIALIVAKTEEQAAAEEQATRRAAAASSASVKKRLTVTVTNTLEKTVELYVVGTQKEMDSVIPTVGNGHRWTDATKTVAKLDRKMTDPGGYANGVHGRFGYRGAYRSPTYNSNTDPKTDLGITFRPNSSPPEIMAVDQNSEWCKTHKLKPGMKLSAVSKSTGYAYDTYVCSHGDDPAYCFPTKNKTHQQVMAHIRSHKRPIILVFCTASTAAKKHLGTLQAASSSSSSSSINRGIAEPRTVLMGMEGAKLVAEVAGKPVMNDDSLTFTDGDLDLYICQTHKKAQKKKAGNLWAKFCKQRVADRFKLIDSTVLATTEGELLDQHIQAIHNPAELINRYQYTNLRTLQDSPRFGLSEGYVDKATGATRQLAENPPQLAVTLRNYQSQAVQWMLDHEARSSISEPFWAEVPMAVSSLRRPANQVSVDLQPTTPSPTEGKLWYCHISGKIAETPPEGAVGGILAEEMGMGKTVEVLGLLGLTADAMRQWRQARPAGDRPRGGTLICCPVSLYGQWKAEIRSKLHKDHQMSIYDYHTGRRFDPELIAKADIVLTCYSIMNREEGGVKLKGREPFTCPLKNIDWYRVVLDECHAIKEAGTQQSKMACSLETRRRWAVTGTVMQTKHDDIAPLYQFLRMEPFDTAAGWKEAMYTHSAARRNHNSGIALTLLSQVMKHTVMRHTKTQVFEGEEILKLPGRTQCVRLLKMSDEEAQLYEELERRAKRSFAGVKDVQRETLKVISLLLPLRMLASSSANLEAKHVSEEGDAANPEERAYTEKELVQLLQTTGRKLSKTQAEAVAVEMQSSTASCSVCLDTVESPTSTACGHVFCHECISGVVHSTPGDTAPCPICRVPVKDSTLLRLAPKPVLSSSGGTEGSSEDKVFEKLLAQTQGKRSTKVTALLASLHEMRRTEPKAKAVVFTSFAKTHKETVQALKAANFGVVEIRGNMTQKARSKALESFIADDSVSIFALSLRSGAVGLTLTAASRCFLMEPCVNEGTELQVRASLALAPLPLIWPYKSDKSLCGTGCQPYPSHGTDEACHYRDSGKRGHCGGAPARATQ